jgi:hypothetical protein
MKIKLLKCYLSMLVILGTVISICTGARAATFTVDDDGGADYITISAAMAVASSGDTIQVLPGEYNENVILNPGVILFGSGPEQTTIIGEYVSGGGNWPAVKMAEGSTIGGFKVTGGFNGISSRDCTSIIMNNVISGNTHVGISLVADVTGSTVNTLVINNTIADNVSSSPGGFSAGIYTEPQGTDTEASPVIMNNIITGHKFGISPYSASPVVSYNDVWDNTENYGYNSEPGDHDISEDPLFADSDYHLGALSPCIDAGNPAPQYVDQDGTTNDMGAYGGVVSPGYGDGFHAGSGFIFTSIGKIPSSEIIQESLNPSHGLAKVNPKLAGWLRIPAYTDSPFGGNLWLHGLFGENDNIDYYQILVGEWQDGNPPEPRDYVPLNDPLSKVKYTINPDSTVTPQYVNLGPLEFGGIENLYKLTETGFWSHIDLRMIWNTRLWKNGKYTLIYHAYRIRSIFPQTLSRVMLPANDLNHLTVVVDNSPVSAEIHHVKYDPASPFFNPETDGEIPECGMIYLTSDQENLRFTITAFHPNGFLKNFVLDTLYGKNRYGGIIKSAAYNPAILTRPYWHGVQETEYSSAASASLYPWQGCAYQFRLRVYSRTTNGFTYIIGKEFNDHYFLDLKQCLADLDGDGDVDGDDLFWMSREFGSDTCLPLID